MKKMIDFFIDRPLLVNLFTAAVLLVGTVFIFTLQKEIFPKVDFDVIFVNTVYPGSSAEDVEKLVTISLERKLKEVSGIKRMNALSMENQSFIIIELDPEYELDEVLDDVKNATDQVSDLPEDVEVPLVTSLDNKDRGIIKVVLTGEDYTKIREVSKKLRDELELMREISTIELEGYRVDEIRIEMDPVQLNALDVTIGEIGRAIRERNLNLSAGKIEAQGGDLFVRTVAEFESLDDIRKVVVRSNSSGEKILISDVANVIRQPTEDQVLQRSNGKRAIFLDVKIKESADIISSTDELKKRVSTFFNERPEFVEGVGFGYADDASYWVKRRLNILRDNGVVGMALVFICLLLFLNFRTSFITSLGAPIAFMISFILMEPFGMSLNMISMFGLIMVLGMLVDDSIIVAEYYFQKLEEGLPPKEAARQAAYETVAPVSATIFTTVVAFGALFFMGGIMGKFVWSIPAVVILCLMASLFECYFVLPSHLADFCRITARDRGKRWYDGWQNFYGKSLRFFLNWHWAVFIGFFFILGGSVFLMKTMKFELFPGDDVRLVFMQIKGKVGAPLGETDKVMHKLEEIALKEIRKDELDQIKAQVGVLVEANRRKTGSHYGSLMVYLSPPQDRKRSTDEIVADLSDKFRPVLAGYTLTSKQMKGGPPRGKPVDIEITGDDLGELLAVSKAVEAELAKVKGVTTTEIDFEEGKRQVVVRVNDEEARRLGLSTAQIAAELRLGFSGDGITEIRESEDDIEIKLFMEDGARSKVATINMLSILNNQGRQIPLKRVINLEEDSGAFVIRRKDRKRVISVTADLNMKLNNPVSVAKNFRPSVQRILKDHPDMHFTFAGENEDTQESMQNLKKAFIIATVCIFLILIVMFGSIRQSFVVMLAIPLGLIGVIIAFKIASKSLSFMAMLGVVALVGVVVNDSIVLVNFINHYRKSTDNLIEAIHKASVSRFRPVILTTVTTVAGLLPIAHPIVGKVLSFGYNTDSDPFVQPMAMSFAWGLLFASIITLVFVPSSYLFFETIKDWLSDKILGSNSESAGIEGGEKTTAAGT